MALQIIAQSVYTPITSNVGVTAVKPGATSLARPPAVTGGANPPSIQSSTFWKNKFDAGRSFYYNTEALPLSQSSDEFDYYNLAYSIDEFTSMFEGSGDTSYLDQVLTLVINMINNARLSSTIPSSQFKDGFMGWVSFKNGQNGDEQALYEIYNWRYVTRLLDAMKKNTAVFNNSTYRAKYDQILAFTEVNIFDKWYTRGPNTWIYRSVTHISCHFAYIALYLRKHTLNTTRQQRCDTIRTNIESVGLPNALPDNMRSKITASLGRAVSGAYSWNSHWNDTSRPGQDVAHANGDITFICESFDNNTGVWTQTDIDRFVKTLTQLCMPTHALYVDGTGTDNGWIADGWPKLGRFSVPCQQALEVYDVQGQGQYMAMMYVNAKRWGV